MKRQLLLLLLAGVSAPALFSQRHEIGLTLGRFSRVNHGAVELGTGTALQANYGLKLISSPFAALYAEVHFLANPQRLVTSTDRRATRDVATLYVTPGIRVVFRPAARIRPWLSAGGGYALHEHSLLNGAGAPNPAPRFSHTGVVAAGAGVDASLWKWLGARLEVRDFYTGKPVYNVPTSGSRQNNIVFGGGFVLRF